MIHWDFLGETQYYKSLEQQSLSALCLFIYNQELFHAKGIDIHATMATGLPLLLSASALTFLLLLHSLLFLSSPSFLFITGFQNEHTPLL